MATQDRKLRMVSPSVLLCIGQTLLVLSIGVSMFVSGLDINEKENSIPLALIGLPSVVVCIVGASIAIARYAQSKRPISGAICLLISSIIAGLMVCLFATIFEAFYEFEAGGGIWLLITVTIMMILLLSAGGLMSRDSKIFKQLTVGWNMLAGLLIVWCIVVLAFDPWQWCTLDTWGYHNRREVETFNIITSILLFGVAVFMVWSWIRVIKHFKAESKTLVTVTDAQYQQPQQQTPYQQSQIQNQQQYQSQQQAQYQQQQYVAQQAQPVAQNAMPQYEQPINPQIMAWAQGLTPEQLKYVILNPGAYDKQAVDACSQELARRV